MQPQMKMVCPNSYVEYQQVVKCLCARERAGIIWMVGAGRRLARGCRGTETREVSPSFSLVC